VKEHKSDVTVNLCVCMNVCAYICINYIHIIRHALSSFIFISSLKHEAQFITKLNRLACKERATTEKSDR
jgi:hypothetical protein